MANRVERAQEPLESGLHEIKECMVEVNEAHQKLAQVRSIFYEVDTNPAQFPQKIQRSARKKIAEAIVKGKAIKIEGGAYKVSGRGFHRH